MAPRLWRTGLLLCFIHACLCLEEECVLGVVGRPVSLPCFYPDLLTSVNYSIVWRTDEEVVLRARFQRNKSVEELGANSASISEDAPLTGNFSLTLPAVESKAPKVTYSLFTLENQSAALCTVCLRVAARFSRPQLQREDAEMDGGETAFLCHSSGGFPEPRVHWLINDSDAPPEGSVRTVAESLPDSYLYNITSHLTVNISSSTRVSCTIENLSTMERETATSYGPFNPVMGKASDAMWIFSTALCAVVGIMVAVGVGYQIHLDRVSKRKKKDFQQHQRGYRRRNMVKEEREELETMKPDSKETDV